MNQVLSVALIPVFMEHRDWALPDSPSESAHTETEKANRILQAMKSEAAFTELGPTFKMLLQSDNLDSESPLTSRVESTELPSQAAARMLTSLQEHLDLNLNDQTLIVEYVAYLEGSEAHDPLLVYSVVIPQLATFTNTALWAKGFSAESSTQTTVLFPAEPESHSFLRHLLLSRLWETETASAVLTLKAKLATLSYWADALTTSNAAIRLLPKYFTMNQLRDVYQAVFGLPSLDSANFSRWVTGPNADLIVHQVADTNEVTKSVAEALKFHLGRWQVRDGASRNDRGTTLALLKQQLQIGASPILKGNLFALLPLGVTSALARSASEVAFQFVKKGKQSIHWYQAAKRESIFLKDRFGIRPSWMIEGKPIDQISALVAELSQSDAEPTPG